ncbi:hypothetical protein TESG_05553 [Trichophyton tonsurans CBS 112818]|uniref:Uncharacterized protein n=1 Tax=Trichophyton tonsurans (strain CBS 112818) TaxID=647933 RepID=F2S3L8_TRIT1|nr:hypothetical protein TESG_05553 [Trichophyton tonsurans CBS 112818]
MSQTFSGRWLSFEIEIEEKVNEVTGKNQPIDQVSGDKLKEVLKVLDISNLRYYCCPEKELETWRNCAWHGKRDSCFDNHCDVLSGVQLTSDSGGGGGSCGLRLERERVFCCDPKEGEHLFLPVPLENLFEHPPTGDNVKTDFELNLDDEDSSPGSTAFQFVVMTSPDEIQTYLDRRDGSHWEVFGCNDAVTESEHTVQMVCTDFSENSNCHKISLGEGVPGTILQMPKGCGPGKYAVAISMEPAKHQLIPRHLASRVPSKGVVYDLKFDYDFSRVPRGMGNTQMRVDFSNQDNYWDEVVAASPSKKRKRSLDDVGGDHLKWLEDEFRDDYHFGGLNKRDLHERWFGSSVIEWLKKMVTPEIKREYTHSIDETVTAVIVDENWDCKRNGIKYDGHVTAKALTNMKISTTFGFTLIVPSLLPPLDLTKSYLTFYNKGEITATLTVDAIARFTYSKQRTILTLPFSGATFRIPGIVTIGPQVHISGSIDAQATVAAKFETKVDIAKWEIRQTLPSDGSKEYNPQEIAKGDPDLSKSGDFSGIQRPEFYAGIEAAGDIVAKLNAAAGKPKILTGQVLIYLPSWNPTNLDPILLEFGVRFDDGWGIGGATAGVVGEGRVMVKMATGISTTAECPFTYDMQLGTHLYARADARIFKWPETKYEIVGWDKDIIKGGECPDLSIGSIGGKSLPLSSRWVTENNITSPHISHNRSLRLRAHELQKRAAVYGPAFRIPVGDLFCPTDDNKQDIGDPKECWRIMPITSSYTYAATMDSYRDISRRHGRLEKRASKESYLCHEKSMVIPDLYMKSNYPSSGSLPNAPVYGFTNTDCTNFDFGTPLPARYMNPNNAADKIKYETEHVLEFQLPGLLLTELNKNNGTFDHPDPNQVDAKGNRKKISFCEYVKLQWLDPLTINGATKSAASHIADIFPTMHMHNTELIVLEDKVNFPFKAKVCHSFKTYNSTYVELFQDSKPHIVKPLGTQGLTIQGATMHTANLTFTPSPPEHIVPAPPML